MPIEQLFSNIDCNGEIENSLIPPRVYFEDLRSVKIKMEFSVKFDTVKSGWSMVYTEEPHVIISIGQLSENPCCLRKRCRP